MNGSAAMIARYKMAIDLSWLDDALPEGWERDDPMYGESFNLVCPHDYTIEQDGECPEGCVSPLIAMGLI